MPTGTHAVLVLDRAGWHVSADLVVPANLTLVHLPPYSPELNPVEKVWHYLRDRQLSHRVLAGLRGRPRRRLPSLERGPRRARPAALAHQLPVAARVRRYFVRPARV